MLPSTSSELSDAPVPPDHTDDSARALVARLGALMFRRNLTDVAGGNLSMRFRSPAGAIRMAMTPRYAGHSHQWQLEARDILIFDESGNVLASSESRADGSARSPAGTAEASRDIEVHRAVYEAVPEACGIVHAHAPACLVFATAGWELPVAIDAAAVMGATPCLSGEDEIRDVSTALARARHRVAAFAAAVLVARHGIVVAGCDLEHAYDGLERMEANARTRLWLRCVAEQGLVA